MTESMPADTALAIPLAPGFLIVGIGQCLILATGRLRRIGDRARIIADTLPRGQFCLPGTMPAIGGPACAWPAAEYGRAPDGHCFGFVMEPGVVPALMLWQTRGARRFAAP